MSLISAGSISLDSTFKRKFEKVNAAAQASRYRTGKGRRVCVRKIISLFLVGRPGEDGGQCDRKGRYVRGEHFTHFFQIL